MLKHKLPKKRKSLSKENLRVAIISGLSGSGKSTTIKVLEDLGFFCVDNLPVLLLPKFLELCQQSADGISKVALVVDIREKNFLQAYPKVFKNLKKEGYQLKTIFLECSDKALVQRFSETRRRHPLVEGDSILESIARERGKLADLKQLADKVIDTSNYNVHELKEAIDSYFKMSSDGKGMAINLISFGYRYGTPVDADLVMDVRFLPNPYFIEELKPLTGIDPRVAEFVLQHKDATDFLGQFSTLISFLIPRYQREGKSYLTIAVGCTGGRHRSVTIVNQLEEILTKNKYSLNVRHRDWDRH
ncbi:MAG: RNase adapter RapZ [Deltaproteobacteria bacterium]|nr:MAG: RNase adapter RapZ [Deltaproteobacteria bacterium]